MFLAIEATVKGLWQAISRPRSVFFLYVPNLALSACVAVPIYALLNDRLAASPAARESFSRYDGAFTGDFLRIHSAAFDSLAAATAVAGILWFLCWLFVEGGALAVLAEPTRKLTLTGFFAACGRNFFAFVRGLVPAAIATWLLAIANTEAQHLVTWYLDDFRGGAAGTNESFWVHVGKTTLFFALFVLLVLTPTAFARVRAVVDDDRSMLRGYFAGLGLCLKKPFTVLLFVALNAALFLSVFVLVDEFTRRIPLDRDFTPLAALGPDAAKFDLRVPPVGLHITAWQVALWFLMTLLVARCGGLIAIWRATTTPKAKHDPELVYARGPVVDVPATRRGNRGYAMIDDDDSRR